MGIPGSSPWLRPPTHPAEGKLASWFATSARQTASPLAGEGGRGGCERSCPRCAPEGRPPHRSSAPGLGSGLQSVGVAHRGPRGYE